MPEPALVVTVCRCGEVMVRLRDRAVRYCRHCDVPCRRVPLLCGRCRLQGARPPRAERG